MNYFFKSTKIKNMPSSVAKLVNTIIDPFPSTHLPSKKYSPAKKSNTVSKKLVTGQSYLYVKDFHYIPSISTPGHLRNKTRAPKELSGTVTADDLLNLIKKRYAYLLQPKTDGSGYVIDLSSLHHVKMRKRYVSLGCVISTNKDLTTATVTGTDESISPSLIFEIAQLALALFSFLENVCTEIYTTITSKLPWTTRIEDTAGDVANAVAASATTAATIATDTGNSTAAATATTVATAASSVGAVIATATDVDSLTSTQKELYPFQHGTPQFIDRVNSLVLSDHGLLYHISGMDHSEMVKYINRDISVTLPSSIAAELSSLPLVQLGQKYWDNIKVFIEDSIKKGVMTIDEIAAYIASFNLPKTWTEIESLVYILWQQLFNHTLLVKSATETWQSKGVYFTKDGKTVHQGTKKAVDALQKFYSLNSTSLVATTPLVTSPSLSRKFISLQQLIASQPEFKEFGFLSPDKVSITLV